MKFYNSISFTMLVIANIFFFMLLPQQSVAQGTDNWHLEYTTPGIQSATVSIGVGGAYDGMRYLKTTYNGSNKTDSVIWGHGGFNVPFSGVLKIATRSTNSSIESAYSTHRFYHGDTTIYWNGGLQENGSDWIMNTLDQIWSGALTSFDSIDIIEFYGILGSAGAPIIADFDDFTVTNNGVDSTFYDGGEKTCHRRIGLL